jgi:hypothetical protein
VISSFYTTAQGSRYDSHSRYAAWRFLTLSRNKAAKASLNAGLSARWRLRSQLASRMVS